MRYGRFVVAAFFAGAAVVLGRPIVHIGSTVYHDANDRIAPPRGSIDDASYLNQTRVVEVWSIPEDSSAAESQLVALMRRAAGQNLKVAIAGARHSMGGHSIRADGIVLNMLPFRAMSLDESQRILHVQAGARWSEVLETLNSRGWSVGVMQSNNDFSVGGSISVNCHGWQCRKPPISSTVEAFRILLADGRILRCSREENPELFSLALGGYGLFGVILDVDLRIVPNEQYRPERFAFPTQDYAATFHREVVQRDDVAMAYGRLSVAPESFLGEASLNVFHRVPGKRPRVSSLGFPESATLTRAIVRGEAGSDYGKSLRWRVEQSIQPLLSRGPIDRNQLLSQPATVFENRSNASTDILHEYFVPPRAFASFVDLTREIILRSRGDLLNVTIRDVRADTDTFLSYADEDMFALVMLFHQLRTPEGEKAMETMTQGLIAAALQSGGRHYLPYRLHATREQFTAAYPKAPRFFELKKTYDPEELFENTFYLKYGAAPRPSAEPRP